jgi:surface antigen
MKATTQLAKATAACFGEGKRAQRQFPRASRWASWLFRSRLRALFIGVVPLAFVLAIDGAPAADGREHYWIGRLLDADRGEGADGLRLSIHGMCDRGMLEGGRANGERSNNRKAFLDVGEAPGSVGKLMDRIDRLCVGEVLDHAGDGASIIWSNPNIGATYLATPTRTFKGALGHVCREYAIKAFSGDTALETYSTACRRASSEWQFLLGPDESESTGGGDSI